MGLLSSPLTPGASPGADHVDGDAVEGRLLVVNAGSSTLKLAVLGPGDELVGSELIEERASGEVDRDALASTIERYRPFRAVGHRVVHGGTEFVSPVVVRGDVLERIDRLGDLAPLHQPKAVAALRAVCELLPDVPAVACFDTAFHATIPDEASTYPVPEQWRQRWPLRRFGFHGLSHAYASRRAAEMAGDAPCARVVTCHLGAGASLAAVRDGTCVDTTMGFTPLEGLVMASRSGTVDPGLVLWLAGQGRLRVADISDGLERAGGLLGLAGTADMREVLAREAAGDERARLAMSVYLHRFRALTAAMVAALGGLDVLVFTGGIGERSPEVRARAVAGLEFLGAGLSRLANEAAEPDATISPEASAVKVLVVAAREDLEIARGVRSALAV